MLYHKPTDISNESWTAYCQKYKSLDGMLVCQSCQKPIESHDHVADHIYPEAECVKRGIDPHSVSNRQPMHYACNAHKSGGVDSKWDYELYFDQPINKDGARAYQRLFVYDQVLKFASEFAQPYGNINSRLFLFPGIVGCGKTVGQALFPFALNHCWNEIGRKGPRVRTTLTLAKDMSLRKQLAHEYRSDLTGYGIVSSPPRVLEVDKPGEFLAQIEEMQNYDFVVACPQGVLWDNRDGLKREQIDKILRYTQLVVWDETHWAYEQIQKMLKAMQPHHCLGAGFTATPFKKEGVKSFLQSVACFEPFGYTDAIFYDQSMKGIYRKPKEIEKDEPDFSGILRIVKTKKYVRLDGSEVDISDSDLPQLKSRCPGLPEIESLLYTVVQTAFELDQLSMTGGEVSSHRTEYGDRSFHVQVGKEYWPQFVIRVNGAEMCGVISDSLNEYFNRNRGRFPIDRGYRCEFANGQQPLDRDGGFFYQDKNDTVSARATRFIVVDELLREGINNRHVFGQAYCYDASSIVEGTQSIGRNIRSVDSRSGKTVLVPRRELDQMVIWCHESHGATHEMLENSLRFIANMEGQIKEAEGIVWVEDYFEQVSIAEAVESDPSTCITRDDKRRLAYEIQYRKSNGIPLATPDIIAAVSPSAKQRKQEVLARKVRDYKKFSPKDQEAVRKMEQELGILPRGQSHEALLQPLDRVKSEKRDFTRTPEELAEFFGKVSQDAETARQLSVEHPEFLNNAYRYFGESFESSTGILKMGPLRQCIVEMSQEFQKSYRKVFGGKEGVHAKEIAEYIVDAVAAKLDVSRDKILDTSEFDHSSVVYQLKAPRLAHRQEVESYVFTKLVANKRAALSIKKFLGL